MSTENRQWVLISKTEKEISNKHYLNTIKDKYFIYKVVKRGFLKFNSLYYLGCKKTGTTHIDVYMYFISFLNCNFALYVLRGIFIPFVRVILF